MKEARLQVVVALGFFWLLALVTWPDVLDVILPVDYIGEPEERRYFTTFSLAAFGCGLASLGLMATRARSVVSVALYVMGVALFVELSCAALVYGYTGRSHLPRVASPFTFHPSLVGMPTPGYRRTSRDGISIAHNSSGFRGVEFGERVNRRTRILAIGGSTTYGVLVSNDDTWPVKLGALLGSDFEVLNLGVPGHSSAEHVILTALRAADFAPDYIVFYMGWNDIRSSHLKNLRSDYSNFHLLEQYGSLQVERRYESRLAVLFLLKWVLVRVGELEPPKEQLRDNVVEPSQGIDERLVRIYERNIRTLVLVSRAIGAEPVLVPQVLNRHYQTSGDVTWWAPGIPTRDLVAHCDAFNDVMRRVAEAMNVRFVAAPQAAAWENADFVDHGHFSPSGNQTFAGVLHDELRDYWGTKAVAESPESTAAGSGAAAARQR